MLEAPLVDLDALEESAGKVRIKRRAVNVLPLTGDGWRLVQELADSASSNEPAKIMATAGRIHGVVAKLVPDLSHDEVMSLTFTQCSAIVQVAIGQIETVRAALEKQFAAVGDPQPPAETTSPLPPA